MSYSNRQRRPGRGKPFRQPNLYFLLLCEGETTEREYFEGFALAFKNPLVVVKVADKTGVPLSLVKQAKKLWDESITNSRSQKDTYLEYDQVWCVFDVDDHPNLKAAETMARDNGIEVAISNPCFELWLLLHFQEAPGASDRGKIRRLLRKYIKNYNKHVDFSLFKSGYSNAKSRANAIYKNLISGEGVLETNPSTGVHRLTEAIELGKSKPSRKKRPPPKE